MSIIKANKWQDTTGNTFQSIIQVVSAIKTNTATYSTGTSSWVDVDGLSVNITPRYATSKIMILCQISGTGSSDNYNAYFRINRNGTIVGSGSTESGYNSAGGASAGCRSFNVYFTNTMPINFLDSPNTTSTLTYKIQTNNGNTTFINRGPGGTNDGWAMVLSSTITVMEIAQ